MAGWISEYVDAHRASEVPEKFWFWSGISAVAGALRRKVYLPWGLETVYPNMYILLVGDPGVKKSTALKSAQYYVSKVDGVIIGPNATTWPAFVKKLAESANPYGDETHCSMSVFASEFAAFYRRENDEMQVGLTDLWDCQTWTKDTKGNDNDIVENPCLNMIGALVPSWLRENCDMNFLTSGFSSRCIYVHGRPSGQYFAKRKAIPMQVKTQLVQGLQDIGAMSGECDMTEECEQHHTDWYMQICQLKEAANEVNQHFYARLQYNVMKLAMILACSEGSFTIELEHHLEAERLMGEVEGDTQGVTAMIGRTKVTGAAEKIVKAVKDSKQLSYTALFATFWGSLESEEFNKALKTAEGAGYVRVIKKLDADTVVKYVGV